MSMATPNRDLHSKIGKSIFETAQTLLKLVTVDKKTRDKHERYEQQHVTVDIPALVEKKRKRVFSSSIETPGNEDREIRTKSQIQEDPRVTKKLKSSITSFPVRPFTNAQFGRVLRKDYSKPFLRLDYTSLVLPPSPPNRAFKVPRKTPGFDLGAAGSRRPGLDQDHLIRHTANVLDAAHAVLARDRLIDIERNISKTAEPASKVGEEPPSLDEEAKAMILRHMLRRKVHLRLAFS